MKRDVYTVRVMTADGVLRSVGTVTFEGNQIVHSEHKSLDTKEELERRRRAIAARCVFEE